MRCTTFSGLAALVIAVSGCGGSGSPVPFDSQSERLSGLIEDTRDQRYTRVSSLPTTGSVNYQGVAALSVTPTIGDGTEQLLGSMGMNVRFNDNTVTASITGLVDSEDRPYAGRLTMDNGVLNRSITPRSGGPGVISGDLEGTLIRPVLGEMDIRAELNSNFLGNGSWMLGSVFDAGDMSDGDRARVTGGFILDRQ